MRAQTVTFLCAEVRNNKKPEAADHAYKKNRRATDGVENRSRMCTEIEDQVEKCSL